jgi:mannose-6-phosphate isomerase-like protein (cupin superfamily)
VPSRKLAGRTIGDPDGSFVIAEWTEGPAPQEGPRFVAPLHVHHRDDEAWYVLEGALRFRLDDEEREARAGEAVFAPRGTAHTYWNPGSDPARYVLVMTPTIFALINAIHAATERERDPKTLSALFAAFDSEILEDRSQR